MAKSDVFKNDILKLIFNSIPISGLAKNDSSNPLTELTVALHTADPGEDGDQSTNEISYTGYARVSVTRADGSGWVVTGNAVSPANNITFGRMTGGVGGIATHASVGTGVGDKMLYKGAITPNITIITGKTPRLTPGSVITES